MKSGPAISGFTLIELLTALLILSLLSLMSYRGLGAALDARGHVSQEVAKWQRVAAFSTRLEQDLRLAAPQNMRKDSGGASAWMGRPDVTFGPRLEFNRFAAVEGVDMPQRVAYGLNDRQQIELWLWPGLDAASDALPVRHAVLDGVTDLEFQYLNADLAWVNAWPMAAGDAAIPRALRLRFMLSSGEEIMRVFALDS
jgi:general secretion pathway protein J